MMGRVGDYGDDIHTLLHRHGELDVMIYMMYDEPGERDMLVLQEGIENMYYSNVKENGEYAILAEYIDIQTAIALNVYRGWKITICFIWKTPEEIRKAIAENLLLGFDALKVKAELLEQKEMGIDV